MMDIASEIKQRVSLNDVLTYYGTEVGRGGFAHCPFHSGDRSASLKVYPGQNTWHCFGCGKGGTVIDYVMEMENCSFRDALKRLDDMFYLGLTDEKPSLRSQLTWQRQKEQARLQDEIRRKNIRDLCEQRRALWMACKALQPPQTHEEAQSLAEMLSELDKLDEKLSTLGSECE